MVKTYLKYGLSRVLGQTTGKCSPKVDSKQRFIFTSCNEYIIIYNLKTSQIYKIVKCDKVSKSPINDFILSERNLFIGYQSGEISQYSLVYGDELDLKYDTKYSNHKSAITSLDFNPEDNYLLSASTDTTIIVTDIISEIILYRLQGHKDNIIQAEFLNISHKELGSDDTKKRYIISASKDNTIKIWNTQTQECLQTLCDFIHKVNRILVLDDMLIVGLYDSKIRLYKLAFGKDIYSIAHLKGILSRQSSSKIINMSLNMNNKLLVVLSADNTLEFFKVLSEKELLKRLMLIENSNESKKSKNKKREILLSEKQSKATDSQENEHELNKILKAKSESKISQEDYNFKLRFYSFFNFYEENKINSIFPLSYQANNKSVNLSKGKWKFGLNMNNNSIEIYEMNNDYFLENIFKNCNEENPIPVLDKKKLQVKNLYGVNYGHKDRLRWVKFSSSNSMFITCSNESVLVWNYFLEEEKSPENYLMHVPVKVISIDGQSILVGIFVFGDKYIVLGSKQGFLIIVDTLSCQVLGNVKAHEGEIWNIVYFRQGKDIYIVTCSSDKKVNYWKFDESTQDGNYLELSNSVQTLDQITYMLISPSKKFLVYSMLDNSIRINYQDSGKNFLSLYGHKLPVLSFDISSDNTLLVSGSGDKNVKIWGMDFGDCHRSFFAHKDSVTSVKFVAKTHYFFSAGKDGVIRYWDADTVSLIYLVRANPGIQ